MKCHKCSYVSFDHLSECRKCGVSLEDARSALGFTSQISAVPFLLGVLLSDESAAKQSQSASLQANEASDEFSSVDMGEGFELFGDDEGHEEVRATEKVPVRAEMHDARGPDARVAGLSDEAMEPSIFLDDEGDFSLSLSFDRMSSDGALDDLAVLPEARKPSVTSIDRESQEDEADLLEDFELEDASSEDLMDFDFSQDTSLEVGEGKTSSTQPDGRGGKQSRGPDVGSYDSKPSQKTTLIKTGRASEELDLPELKLDDLELGDLFLESDASEETGPANRQEKMVKEAGAGQEKKTQPSRRPTP